MAEMLTKAELVEDVNMISEDQIYTIAEQDVVLQEGEDGGQYSVIQVNDQEYMLVVADGQAIQAEDGTTTVMVEAPVQPAGEPEMSIAETPRTRRTNRMFHRTRAAAKNSANTESVYDFEEDARNAQAMDESGETSIVTKQEEDDEEDGGFQFATPKIPKPRGRPKGVKKEPKNAVTPANAASTSAVNTSTSSTREGSVSGGNHACTYCDYTTNKRYLLSRHLKSHSEDRPHQCSVCERGFKTLNAMQNHVNTHSGIRPHNCKFCEANFTTSGELVRHVRYKHTLEKPHRCSECDYASVELSKLKRHMRCHTGERPYQCEHCTYASPDTYKLKRHLRIHTGEKPYECGTCGAKFTQSNSLKSHMLIHSGTKPSFKCPHCPTTCGRKTDLRIHVQKLHTSDKLILCKRCDQTFTDRYSYKAHQKTHEGEKCFKCDLCSYASTSQRHLDTHMLIHTDQKPFSCEQCHLTFRQKQLLKRHNNLYHTPNYVTPTPKEKTHQCSECQKQFRHKGNLMRHMYMHDPDKAIKSEYIYEDEEDEEMEILDGSTLQVADPSQLSIITEDGSQLPEGTIAFTIDQQDEKMEMGDGEMVVYLQYNAEDGTNGEAIVVQPTASRIGGKKRRKADTNVIDTTQTVDSVVEIDDGGTLNDCFGFKAGDDDEDEINLSMSAIDCQ